jgi:nitroreductase
VNRPEEPRAVVAAGLAPDATRDQTVRWALAHAALAPSEHNSQPWRFDVRTTRGRTVVDVLLDRSRHLAAVDPADREARLACGAAVLNLRLALRGAGWATTLVLPDDGERPELVASVAFSARSPETAQERELRRAIPARVTSRGPLESTPLPVELLDSLVAEGAREGGFVTLLDRQQRAELLALTRRAEQQLRADPAYRREAAAWARRDRSRHRDGVPGYAAGAGAVQSWIATLAMDAEALQARQSPATAALIAAPSVVVISSPDDSAGALVRAGASMQRLLLRATACDVRASYANAALHVPDLRSTLGARLDLGFPQVVLRLGYGVPARRTPRRRVQELLVPHVRVARSNRVLEAPLGH